MLLLVACTPVPIRKPEPVPTIAQADLDRAAALAGAGDYLAAAALYQELASQASPQLRHELLLDAVENYRLGQDPGNAERLLAEVDSAGLSQDLGLRQRLISAELALDRGRIQEAQALLAAAPPMDATMGLRQRYHRDLGELFRRAGNLLESARQLGELDLLLSDPQERLGNQLIIIQTLATLTDTALELLQPDPPGIQGGWMELARITKAYSGDPQQMQSLLAAWRERFPEHPALPDLLEGYFQRLKIQYRRPSHLALLLPRSGPFADAATALRDGLLAAYYEQPPERRPRLYVYDSSHSDDIWPLYRQAVDAGADMIVGPLSKEGVSQLARAGELEVPVLALNQVPPQVKPPANLYQFGLSPEDEARQVAERAWSDGYLRALVLTPDDAWGERIYGSFRDRWEALGGMLLERQVYDPKEQEISARIRALLNLDESDQRHRELQQLVRMNLDFEPRRRQDVDFIFFAATPQAARQIRPLIQFHHAADVPVYATSHVYSGSPAPERDRDLEGLKFPDVPWLLEPADAVTQALSREVLARALQQDQPHYPRLYAMGIDSFNLLPHLGRLQTSTWEMLEGKTGNLYLDELNYIHRQLVWAQMRSGIPNTIGYTPRMEVEPALIPETVLPTSVAPPAEQPR